MKPFLLIFFLTLFSAPAICGSTKNVIQAPGGYPVSNNGTQSLLLNLIHSNSIELNIEDQEAGCSTAMKYHGSKLTIGEYLAYMMTSLDLTQGHSGVTSECKNIDPTRAFECRVMFLTGAGTDKPWKYGLKFVIDSNGKIDPKKITCPAGD